MNWKYHKRAWHIRVSRRWSVYFGCYHPWTRVMVHRDVLPPGRMIVVRFGPIIFAVTCWPKRRWWDKHFWLLKLDLLDSLREAGWVK